MKSTAQGLTGFARPKLALLAAVMVAAPTMTLSVAGCAQGPRMQAPFTLSDPTQRHPIQVGEGEAMLDIAAPRGTRA
ncbi:hypothetical protein AUC70_01025 [Methyloceanibacter stevinii]|uniref:Uncharacterized protein n=1 Tax=Methyloceanibacter stevinii TaxID=1774970 RepID=A0A1E3VPT8_9HYPH|nr:hypothetical protein [Methyloceanibacter stevinii]ODR95534.1 hypothetical protein AUC70_01025 [Methyloceanibacter stevinii]